MKNLKEEIQRSKQLMGIVEGLNLPKKVLRDYWVGTDQDLLVSLDDYRWVGRQSRDRDYDDEWLVMYKYDENTFCTGWIRESDLDNIMLGNEWADEDDINQFLGYVGITSVEEWVSTNFLLKFNEMVGYYGFDTIIGTSYNSFTLCDAIAKLNDHLPPGDSGYMIDECDESIIDGEEIN